MGSYLKYRDEELKKDPLLKEEYDALEPEYDIIQAMIDARRRAMEKTAAEYGYDIRTPDGLCSMLKDLADGYPEYRETPFSVVLFDESRACAGAYVIKEHEIRIFSMEELSDIDVIEIAIHELAHHIDTCTNNGECSFHSRKFYRILFDLLAKADSLGIAAYGEISQSTDYLPEIRGFGRPHDIQIMEHYYGRPDGKPVDRKLLEKELNERRSVRKPKSVKDAQKKERAERRKKEEAEWEKKKAALERDIEDLRSIFG